MARVCYGICDRFLKQIKRNKMGWDNERYETRSYIPEYDRRVIKSSGMRGSYDNGYVSCTRCRLHLKKELALISKRKICPCCSQILRTVRRDI